MPTQEELHRRLEAVGAKIAEAERALKKRSKWHEGHRLTAGELAARHAFLSSEVKREIRDLEAHGHRVSGLEESLGEWLEGLDLSTG